jgi:hypothetical protein
VLSKPNIIKEYIHAKEHKIFPLVLGVEEHVDVFLPGTVSVGCDNDYPSEGKTTYS